MASTEPRAGFRPPWALRSDPENSPSPEGQAPEGGLAEGSTSSAETSDAETMAVDGSAPVSASSDETSADESNAAAEPTSVEAGDTWSNGSEREGADDATSSVGATADDDQVAGDRWAAANEREDGETAMDETTVDATADDASESEIAVAESEVAAEHEPAAEAEPVAESEAAESRSPASNKLQQDLARAMRATAESARSETLERLAADSAARIEAIRSEVADFATELRQRADDDIAEVREWSKGEIARIRAETDERIAGRKAQLELELEAHEGTVQARIDAVEKRVAAFEANLDAFFEQLSREEDPTRIAVMATALPEAPDLDALAVETPAAEIVEAGPAEAPADAPTSTDGPASWLVSASDDADTGDGSEDQDSDAELLASVDRRLAAFGLDPDTAAVAEQQAGTDLPTPESTAADVGFDPDPVFDAAAPPDTTTPDLDTDGAAPAWTAGADTLPAGTPTETTVVVDGLISVASIAGFKRSLSRLDGVSSVTVTSGPDGEFLFAVKHDPSAALEAGLPGMTGFGVRIVDTQAGTIRVSAHDPEQTADATMNAAGPRS